MWLILMDVLTWFKKSPKNRPHNLLTWLLFWLNGNCFLINILKLISHYHEKEAKLKTNRYYYSCTKFYMKTTITQDTFLPFCFFSPWLCLSPQYLLGGSPMSLKMRGARQSTCGSTVASHPGTESLCDSEEA